ncbi:sulfotransferase domain-containing protein [uncultured Aliiroseovarius sp.]|uniref:sulfotransferase domain-containing protein n=1 Tax=uncultured Aliiroseovarius sp. TaxID=1658783 RepID=UPI002592B19F|nr:sulfotransferase domain-containing protein [uncultured Aliiroseovarius sp.]
MVNPKTRQKVPNLFVIGVAKAGSTSLLQWLSDHPEIGRSLENEPRYLMDPDELLCPDRSFSSCGLEGYSELYEDAIGEDGIRYLIDVTPLYFYQHTAQSIIPTLNEPKVMMTLRQPSKRIYSLYRYAYHNMSLLPDGMSFAEFVQHLEQGESSSVIRGKPLLQDAIFHCHYSKHVRNWVSLVGEKNFFVSIFEETVAHPTKAVREIAGFLGIDPEFYRNYSFTPQNPSITIQNREVHKFARRLRRWIPLQIRRGIKPLYYSLNSQRGTATVSDEDRQTLKYLDELFSEWDLELATLLNRPQAIWAQSVESSFKSSDRVE